MTATALSPAEITAAAHIIEQREAADRAGNRAAFNAAVRAAELSCVVGALLVAPPDVEDDPVDRRLTRFAPLPSTLLPFPTIVVGSRNDPYASISQVRRIAQRWGAEFADGGAIGHVNARSGLGEWAFGLEQLQRLAPGTELAPVQETMLPARPPVALPDPSTITPSPSVFGWQATG